MNILHAIEQTPHLALADKTVKSTDVEVAVAGGLEREPVGEAGW